MKIITKKAGMPYKVEEREKLELEDMQELVGGLIEHIYIGEEGVDLWCNDEGKVLNMPPNLLLVRDEEILDMVQGDIFFAASDVEGEITGLDDKMIDAIEKRFGEMAVLTDDDPSNFWLVQKFSY